MAQAREHEEVWVNTSRGPVYVRTSSPKPNRPSHVVTRRVDGGGQIRISTTDRQMYSEGVPRAGKDIFRNGTMKRKDEPTEAKPLDEEYREDQALTDEELTQVFSKHGKGFHKAVKDLDERNCFRLKDLAEESGDVTAAQSKFLLEHIKENYVSDHKPTWSKEIEAEGESAPGVLGSL